jgi:hypothetical protein
MSIEQFPIRWRKKVPGVLTASQVGSNAKHGFAVAPGCGAKRISGCKKELMPDNAQSARCPDAAASCACFEADKLARVVQGNSNHPAVVISTIAEMAAEGDVDGIVQQCEGCPLILDARIEMASRPLQGIGNINRPAGEDGTVLQREPEQLVTRAVRQVNECIEIYGLGRRIDHRRAGDAYRIDVPARQ